jgi:hypothetical protein
MKISSKHTDLYIREWPRSAVKSYVPKNKRKLPYPGHFKKLALLDDPGIYVLYAADGSVYYVGSGVALGARILTHVKANSRYSRWTHVSAFFEKDVQLRRRMESLLIAAVPAANNGARHLKPHKLPVRAYEG